MEIDNILKCYKCFATHSDMRITHTDDDGNLYCARCAAYLNKVGGYDLKYFDADEFIYMFKQGGE